MSGVQETHDRGMIVATGLAAPEGILQVTVPHGDGFMETLGALQLRRQRDSENGSCPEYSQAREVAAPAAR